MPWVNFMNFPSNWLASLNFKLFAVNKRNNLLPNIWIGNFTCHCFCYSVLANIKSLYINILIITCVFIECRWINCCLDENWLLSMMWIDPTGGGPDPLKHVIRRFNSWLMRIENIRLERRTHVMCTKSSRPSLIIVNGKIETSYQCHGNKTKFHLSGLTS
jgi:hypothetical protein